MISNGPGRYKQLSTEYTEFRTVEICSQDELEIMQVENTRPT